jgi:ATP:ADP antiporter, AAA family
MLAILFLLFFNHNILWNLKDALMITSSGAEVIPFIKVWAILPSVLGFTWIYTALSKSYKQERIFYLFTTLFLLFFGLFAFFVFPFHKDLHPVNSALFLEKTLPDGFKGLIAMYKYWTFTAPKNLYKSIHCIDTLAEQFC